MTDSDEWLERMVALLLPDGARPITLDEVGDAIGNGSVGSSEVEALLTRLEGLGATIVESGSGAEGLSPLLKKVITTAHELRAQGERPSPQNIADKSGLSARAVRVALLYADVLKG